MFSKFAQGSRADIKSTTPLKSSVQRNLKTKLVEAYPKLEPFIEDILPKKSQLSLVKCEERISLYSLEGKVLFFQHFDDALLPALRLVHLYPECFPIVRVDRGAIKFVLSGANIMAPGLTSAGGMLPEGLEKDQAVIIMAEGKEHAVAVGVTNMSGAEMKEKNKGIGIETAHFLGDWLVSDSAKRLGKVKMANRAVGIGSVRRARSTVYTQMESAEKSCLLLANEADRLVETPNVL